MVKQKVKSSDIYSLAFRLENALDKSKQVIESLQEDNKNLKDENKYLKKLLALRSR